MRDFNFDVEYAVQMKCDACQKKIEKELSTIRDLKIVDINVKEQRLVVQLGEKSPSAFQIQNLIEDKLGLNAIIRGTGDFVSAVSEIRGAKNYGNVMGVARFVQNESQQCLLDAVIDGLEVNKSYQLGVHEFGDLSEPNYTLIGDQVFPFVRNASAESTRMNFKCRVDNCDLASFIGRAFAIKSDSDVVGAGIMARASRMKDNTKKICACDGKTLWEERHDNRI